MKYLREGVKKIGLELFVKDDAASPTVTSIKVPHGIDAYQWLGILREKYQVELTGGMGETKGKIIRVAHMGYVNKKDIDGVMKALKHSLKDLRRLSRISKFSFLVQLYNKARTYFIKNS